MEGDGGGVERDRGGVEGDGGGGGGGWRMREGQEKEGRFKTMKLILVMGCT